MTILLVKLLLIPVLLAVVTIVARRLGPAVAGWLGAFPVVAGPVLLILTLEQGAVFGAEAAEFALAGMAAAMTFCVAYGRFSPGRSWRTTAPVAFGAWAVAVALLSLLPRSLALSAVVGFGALTLVPLLLPSVLERPAARVPHALELPARMVVGALLAAISSAVAARFGARLGGYLALFPLVTSVIAIFTHAFDGRAAAAAFVGGMARGLWSAAVFCAVLALALAPLGTGAAFALAAVACLVVHGLIRPRTARPGTR